MERETEKIFERIKEKNCHTISVVGLAKNVGKTTVVNFLLRGLERACVITIGRDGEEKDVIYNVPKPGVHVPKGSFAVVPCSVLPEWGEILETFEAASGKVALVKAKIDVDVQTVRVGSFEVTAKMLKELMKYCDDVLVDGALGRTGISAYTDCTVLVTGAEIGRNVEEVVLKTVRAFKRISTTPVETETAEKLRKFSSKVVVGKNGRVFEVDVDGVAGHEEEIVKASEKADFVYLPGAVTDEIASKLECDIIVPNSGNIFSDSGKFKVLNPTRVVGVAVNSSSVKGLEMDSSELIFELQKQLNDIIVFDVLHA